MIHFFEYNFIIRGLEAGLIIGALSPLIGIFLVARKYSMIVDTISHVSFAGIAIGLFAKINPFITALITTIIASLGIERLRIGKKIAGESALSLFLSGSLAVALILISLKKGFNANLFSYLFGSIVTVTQTDVMMISILAVIVGASLYILRKELIYTSFDEEVAHVSGVKTKKVNTIFILMTASTISLAIPIVGVLLTSALMIIPVLTALQFKKGFKQTLIYAEIASILSVLGGILLSFYLDLSTGGTIVLILVGMFILSIFWNKK